MLTEVDDAQLTLVRAAAERGVCEAQVMYGQMLLDGKLLTQNATAALHWFERSALGGNVMAINMVGRCLDQGWGVAASAHLAVPWFRKAAERGLDWGMYNLATSLILGRGVQEDKMEAYLWLRKAADLKHAKSLNLLAGFYEDGWVVERNAKQALRLYKAAAELGDFRGQFNFARCCALAGETLLAESWVRRVPETATPAFLQKAIVFCRSAVDERLRPLADLLSSSAGTRTVPC